MTLSVPEDPLELSSSTVGRVKLAGAAGLPEYEGDLCHYLTVDPLTGEPLLSGELGELASFGPTTMTGYWRKPEETAAVLSSDGLLRSGDLGLVGPDGYLRVTGRSKELYKSGGELVMPREIEELLSAHDDIAQAFAIGLTDERWGEIGCAVVVRRTGSAITEDDVIAVCKAKPAPFKGPHEVIFLEQDELPKTPTGKVQKYRLVPVAEQRIRGAAQ